MMSATTCRTTSNNISSTTKTDAVHGDDDDIDDNDKYSKIKTSNNRFSRKVFVFIALAFTIAACVCLVNSSSNISNTSTSTNSRSTSIASDVEHNAGINELQSTLTTDNSEKDGDGDYDESSYEDLVADLKERKPELYNVTKIQTTSQASLKAEDGHIYHMIFSTDCSPYQHWQSYLYFHAAMKVKQPGYVTRIASGCENGELEKERQWHEKHIQNRMSDRFRIHFTPHFSGVKDANGKTVKDANGKPVNEYEYFNKPFGLKYYLEFGELMGTTVDGNIKNEDHRIILTDPDMILLRPITGDFSHDREVVIGSRERINRKFKVDHGQPFAQRYGIGAEWQEEVNVSDIAGHDSPAKDVTYEQALESYEAGPPYIATARDMYAISKKWVEFVPKVHKVYPDLMAEMFAFCIAAAHLKLPHQMIDSMMISTPNVEGEGWSLVDKIPIDGVCEFGKHPQHDVFAIPTLIHYCQRYAIGDWFFYKRNMVQDFFTCESPLLMLPSSDVINETDYRQYPGEEREKISKKELKEEGFMICTILAALNDAARFFKDQQCDGGNLQESISLRGKPDFT